MTYCFSYFSLCSTLFDFLQGKSRGAFSERSEPPYVEFCLITQEVSKY